MNGYLVDGQADESHLSISQRIAGELDRLGYKRPGSTGVFGGPAFSHELIHCIGGDADTNRITTRRILLLLESTAIGPRQARDRVIRQLIKRYIEDDLGYRDRMQRGPYVPRFLLNDLVRYWRTIAVDFAAKRREREGKAWALSRFKLRMSRKLIFAAGLATCLSCELRPSTQLKEHFESDEDFVAAMAEFLLEFANRTPLETLAKTVLEFNARDAGRKILNAYDQFLGILSDQTQRKTLENLQTDEAHDNDVFDRSEGIARDFQEGLTKLFFETDAELTRHAQRYGVF